MGREIGKVVEAKGVYVRAELYELFPPYIVEYGKTIISPRINSYVKTRVGLDIIICQITGEYYEEQRKGTFTGYFFDLVVKGYIENNHFIQGVRMLPMVSAGIEMLDSDDFKMINDCDSVNCFSLGTNLFDNTQSYYFDYNTIIPSHIGIFGNTGSGKSNTLAKLLSIYSEILKNTDKGKVLVFDINNEYGNNAICELDMKNIYNLTTRSRSEKRIPLNYGNLEEDDWCVLLNATEATQRPVIKTAYNDNKSKEEYEALIKDMIRTGRHQLLKSMQYNMRDYISGIQNLYWHTTCEVFYFFDGEKNVFFNNESHEAEEYLSNISVNVPEALLSNFLFKLYFAVATHIGYGTQYEFISPLLRRAEKLFADFEKVFSSSNEDLFGGKNIAVIQLANVNKDMLELIPSIIVNHLFHKQIEKKENNRIKDIINVVVDEAHNLLYENDLDRKHTTITVETFERAIKEGRKFGMFLWISSQRPSDISSTIISQMHNYFIHKLVNPNDLSRIRKAVAFLDQNAMDSLTVLGSGECIVSGTGVKMPCFIKINQLSKEQRPNSENVSLFGCDGIFEKDD
ncbi:MAG: ATP-binding protein [Lachnospiraceae bacterium]|nr:ATP-binding protein [Lachnospiraceae bacterium]